MLPLNAYQKRTIDELTTFLRFARELSGERGIRLSFLDQVEKPYKQIAGLPDVPFVCIKIPTGGGKTLVACHAAPAILDTYLQEKNGKGILLWLVPSDAIRSQTLKNLRDANHPYREALDARFGTQVQVLTVDEAQAIQPADVQNNLCIIVSSLAAFRREKTEWLKVFQNNGSLLEHFTNVPEDASFLDTDQNGQVIYSLANVLKLHNPLVFVDEGHNAQTLLSFDMLRSLNPSFVLEFTATPRGESNVLITVLASELKAAHMVAIPIYLSNLTEWQEAIREGIAQGIILNDLAAKEKRATGEYLRPIVLLQAEQEKESETKITVSQVKQFLLDELHISEEEIAIKTGTKDEIAGIELLSRTCPIRYIITVNALKEGWDCPFAYVLVSIANIGASIAVEQTIGRILRLPHAQEKKHQELNQSFVYTSSESFRKAADAIIKGLEQNGYSRQDLRENKGKIEVEQEQFGRSIQDNQIAVPCLSVQGREDNLAFSRDLLGPDFRIYQHYTPLALNFHEDQNQKIIININEDGLYRVTQGKLSFFCNPDDFSLDELSGWLKRNVRHPAIAAEEMGQYIDLALADLSKTHELAELSLNRYRVKEEIKAAVLAALHAFAKQQFFGLLKTGSLTTTAVTYTPESATILLRVCPLQFHKHLFERAGYMNGEESDLAERIDSLDNVAWWYRNREKQDFYLQGWQQGKFYPDFIIKTKAGKYIVVEYKGEDRLSNEDTGWKRELGEIWEKLNNREHRFYLKGKKEVDEMLREIGKIM